MTTHYSTCRTGQNRNERVSIVGAGPGGLTCARILQRHGIPVTVYDRDPHPEARNQGGTLDLHADDGQLALREAGLIDAFFRLARPEGQEMRRLDPAGRLLGHHVPAEGELFKPEIDRGRLREAFSGWSPPMLQMITDNDGPYVDRPLFALPVAHAWEHTPSVTLLGDAAHLMPPLGVGANLAMLDACELALALAGSATVGEAVGVYEKTMLPRAADTARLLENGAGALLERHDKGEIAEARWDG
ncbi:MULTISPECIES: FAD-dependent monooxygenase [unclassified Nonomuraea]|uniref:FAD-dependent oxidoreductase n=1 Tax=unclassified Nonomuraea TaxID=2593643 RepID=UPI0033C9F880